jgi:hypothetical protein
MDFVSENVLLLIDCSSELEESKLDEQETMLRGCGTLLLLLASREDQFDKEEIEDERFMEIDASTRLDRFSKSFDLILSASELLEGTTLRSAGATLV